MAGKVRKLRSMIYEKYDSEAKFADDLGWSRQRLNKITTGGRIPDLDEVEEIANGLDKDFLTIAEIFLNKQSPNERQMEAG